MTLGDDSASRGTMSDNVAQLVPEGSPVVDEWNAARMKLPFSPEGQASCDHDFGDYGFKCKICGAIPNEGGVTRLVPTKSDTDRAAEIKDRIRAAMAPVLALMDESAQAGFIVNFGTAPGPLGRFELQNLHLLKRF